MRDGSASHHALARRAADGAIFLLPLDGAEREIVITPHSGGPRTRARAVGRHHRAARAACDRSVRLRQQPLRRTQSAIRAGAAAASRPAAGRAVGARRATLAVLTAPRRVTTMGVRSWIPLLAAVIAVVCVRLGLWQVDRLEQRKARNATIAAAFHEPPLPARLAIRDRVTRFRRITATGRWDYGRERTVSGRTRNGSPGVHVVRQ